MATELRQLADLIAKLEPELRDAFMAAMNDLRDGIDRSALVAALKANDIEAAINALNIETAAFNDYLAARLTGFARAGQLVSSFIKIPGADGSPVQVRFDMSNPAAERVIREQAATRIVGYTAQQTETARKVILDGFQRGDGSTTIATDIAGRIDPVTKRRTGGIVGLSDPQAEYVRSMRARLASGDAAEMRKVLQGMTLRDRRFDRTIEKAIRDGKPVPSAMIDKMTARYADKLLARRAEDIARTEVAQSVETARAESYRQAMAKANMADDDVEKEWIHSGGPEHARVQHIVMHGQKVTGLDTAFTLPDGTLMKYAHDPAGGVEQNANCRCRTEYKLNLGAGVT